MTPSSSILSDGHYASPMTIGRSAEPSVYVLILNWNGWADTVECLESVFRQKYANYRVVVCDNDSRDDSLVRLRAWANGDLAPEFAASQSLNHLSSPPVSKPIGYIEYDRVQAEAGGVEPESDSPLVLIRTGANLGFAGGNNVGLRYILARGDAEFIWLLNNDTVVEAGALASAVAVAEQNEATGMVGAKLFYYDQPRVIQAVAGGRLVPWQGSVMLLGRDQEDRGQWDGPVELDYITGASLLVKDSVVRAIGLMDELYFMYSEELDWCLRARRHGWLLAYSPECVVWHKEGKSVGFKSALHDYYAVRSALLCVRKFYPRSLPAAILYSIYRSVLPKLVRFQSARLAAVLRAYKSFFLGASA